MGTRRLLAGLLGAALAVPVSALLTSGAAAEGPNAVISSTDCLQNQLARNDDGSTPRIPIGFPVKFFRDADDTSLFVNNNGNVTFDGRLGTYTPFNLQSTGVRIIAPFFGDVDTRAAGSDLVRYGYGSTVFDGRPALCVNWVNVGYYNARADKLNSFQLLLVDRGDVAPGDFDIVFNYDKIQWETGQASGGINGLGGSSARAGYSNGLNGADENSYEIPGSAVNGAFLDSAGTGLVTQSLNTPQLGRFIFNVREGTPVVVQNTAPEVTTSSQTLEGNTTGGWTGTLAPSGVTATDAEDGALTPTSDASGFLPLGTSQVTWTATDSAGLSATASQDVTVVDTTAPALSCPAPVTGTVGQPVDLGTASTTDVVDANPTVGNDAPAGYAPGTTSVSWTSTDASGNSAACAQTVTLTYLFDGFLQPTPTRRNSGSSASTFPFKWRLLTADGTEETSLAAVAGWYWDAPGATFAPLAYNVEDGAGHYHLNSRVPASFARTTRTFTVNLVDGTSHSVDITFVK